MQISIANAIQVARRIGAAAQVITTNLKMWLGFETSETLGRELQTNDFSVDTTGWGFQSATLSVSNNELINTSNGVNNYGIALFSALLENSKSYVVEGYYRNIDATNAYVAFFDGASQTTIAAANASTTNVYFKVTITSASSGNPALKFNSTSTVGQNLSVAFSNISVKEVTQITPDKSGNNNVGELFTGKVLDFDGINDEVDVSGFQMSGQIATFVFWIYPRDTSYQFIMDNKLASGNTDRTILALYQTGSESQKFGFFNYGFKQFGTPTQNQWQRVVFRVNATTVECYVDGVKSGSTLALTLPIDLSATVTANIASKSGSGSASNLDAKLSDFQIYNTYWSTDDIAYDYANPQNLVTDREGTSVVLADLRGYWPLSEGDGLVAYDSSGGGNNGAISGATYEPAQPRIPQLGMMNWSKGSNLYSNSEPTSNEAAASGITYASYSWNYIGFKNATVFGDNSSTRFRYGGAVTSGLEYTLSAFVIMDDNSEPDITNTSSSGDFGIVLGNAVTGGTNTKTNVSGNIWRVSKTKTVSSSTTNNGIIKYTTQSSKGFKVVGWQLEESSSAGAYRLTDGGATLNSTVIPNPTIPTKDIFGNLVRDRLNSFNLGKFGGARVDAFTLSGKQATIQLWFKNVNSNDSLYLADLHSATDRIVLGFNSSQLSVFHEITGGWQNFGTITDGDWNFATFTFDGTSLKCFVGTSQLGVTKTITAINLGTTTEFGIGMNHFFRTRTQDYNGHISDFLIYDRVLTSDEVENNYNAGLSAHTN